MLGVAAMKYVGSERCQSDERVSTVNELKLVLWRFPSTQIPKEAGSLQVLDFDLASIPGLAEHLSAGWTVVSHTFERVDGDGLITLFLNRPIEVPAAPYGL